MPPRIEVKNLKKYFETHKGTLHAVDDVSFKIETGKTMGIVGESGCGKSTLGRTVTHLLPSTDGQILYDGKDVTHINKKELSQLRDNIQLIFQDPYSSLNPRFTVKQTIQEPLRLSGKYNEAQLEAETNRIMDMAGIERRLRMAYPHELDGGRRQRVGIGRALALNPKFIVCDEPVSALDVSVQAQILNLMMELQDKMGLTYIFISHDLSVIKHISDDIGVMYLGQMIEKTTKKAIFARPLHPYTVALLSAIPSTNVREKKKKIILKGEISSPINPKPGCRFAPRCPFAQDACYKESPALNEVEKDHFVACHRSQEMMEGKLHY